MEQDHEKLALVQMLNESMSREIQLRAVLSKMQGELSKAKEEIAALTPPPNSLTDEILYAAKRDLETAVFPYQGP